MAPLTAVVAACAVAAWHLVRLQLSGDAFWDLAAGRWMWQHRAVLTTNLLSWHHRGAPWINIEWLWGVILYAFSRWGPPGLLCCSLLGAAAFYLAIWALSRARGRDQAATVLLILWAAFVSLPFWDFRPQAWAYPLAAWAYWLLDRLREASARPWRAWLVDRRAFLLALAGVTWFWSQLHGSWMLVPLWLLLEAVIARRARWLVLAAATVGLAAAGPFGLANLTHAVALVGSRTIASDITEWQTPTLHSPYQGAVVAAYLFAFGLTFRRPGAGWRPWFFWVGFGLAALYAVRFFPYLALGAVEALSTVGWSIRLSGRFPAAAVTAAAVVVGLSIHQYRGGNLVDGGFVSRQREPVAAVQFLLRHHLTRRVFNTYAWGGYLAYVDIPDWIDGRADFWLAVGHSVQRYVDAEAGRLAPAALVAQSGARVALVARDSPFAWSLAEAGWRRVYEDGVAAVFVRPQAPIPGFQRAAASGS